MNLKQKSYSRKMGTALGLTYCIAALWTVLWLGEPLPDIPIGLAGTILVMYGINRTTPQRSTDATKS